MGINIITGFDLAKKTSLDSREIVADQASRLALVWYYKGLKVRQLDTAKYYEYVGNETSNLTTDWRQIIQIHRGLGVPATTLGFIDDVYIDETNKVYYLKTAVAVWTSQFSFSGSQILVSLTDPPSNTDGQNGDLSIFNNGKIWKKEAGVWAYKFSIAGANGISDKYATTSVTSINLATAVAPLVITVGTGLNYTVGQAVVVASRANNANKLTGNVVSYVTGTGVLTLNTLVISGTGTLTDWDVNLTGSQGAVGKAFIHTESDVNLTQAKITAVQAGGYTTINPWTASILNDTRTSTELTATTNIQGNQVNNSIAYDGVRWWNNGVWRGPIGIKGDKGDQGNPGIQGNPGGNAIVREYEVNSIDFIIPTEITLGNYEIYVNFISSTTAEPTVTLPRQAIGINYQIIINLSPNDSTNRTIIIAVDFSGSNQSGILKSDGLIYLGHRLESTSGKRVVAIFYISKQLNQNSFWILTHQNFNFLSIGSGSYFTKPSAVFNSWSMTTIRNFPTGTYPNLNMIIAKFVRPRIHFCVTAHADTNDHDDVVLKIQRSYDASFANPLDIKTVTYRVGPAWMSLPIEFIDAGVAKSRVYYRLVVLIVTGTLLSADYDVNIHLVPYDVE